MATQKKTTVEALCDAAGIGYGMLNSSDRIVNFVRDGGHRKIPRQDTTRGDLYVDESLIASQTEPERTIEILTVLAVDLDCLEAGESLVHAEIVEAQHNGRYTRIERSRSHER